VKSSNPPVPNAGMTVVPVLVPSKFHWYRATAAGGAAVLKALDRTNSSALRLRTLVKILKSSPKPSKARLSVERFRRYA